jgi:hypothetical protein
MPQLELALSVYECRGLFREHYLTERVVRRLYGVHA